MRLASSRRQSLRVVSLLPSATENFFALINFVRSKDTSASVSWTAACSNGGSESRLAPLPELVGRSHECDFPVNGALQRLPVLTKPRTTFTTSSDIHQQVQNTLAQVSSLYHLDSRQLVALNPDLVLTQSQCKVCSIDYNSVNNAVTNADTNASEGTSQDFSDVEGCNLQSPRRMEIVTLNPTSLHQVLVQQFQQLGQALGLAKEAEEFIEQIHLKKLAELQHKAKQYDQWRQQQRLPKPKVLFVEWLDPLFLGTHGWMRELVELSGGEVIETFDQHNAADQQVDFVIVALCGLNLEKTISELDLGNAGDWWNLLFDDKALSKRGSGQMARIASSKVFVVNGTSMFTRPTGRLLVALEWLIELLAQQNPCSTAYPFAQPYNPKRFGSTRGDSTKKHIQQDIEEVHRMACLNHDNSYKDPATGFTVLTEYYLRNRQTCCGNGCRHCPYGHANVRVDALRKNKLDQIAFLAPFPGDSNKLARHVGGKFLWPTPTAFPTQVEDTSRLELTVMFWSGGKDSLLALSELYANAINDKTAAIPQVVLLTTVDPVTNRVPIQNVSMSTIVAQARELDLPLCLAPMAIGDALYVQKACAALDRIQTSYPDHPIKSLVFGDLHLQDIRAWRQKNFGSIPNRPNLQLRFPLFDRNLKLDLVPKLQQLCQSRDIEIVFAAIESDAFAKQTGLKRGDLFASDQVLNLLHGTSAEQFDFMGEKGEFHTCVLFPKLRREINRAKDNF